MNRRVIWLPTGDPNVRVRARSSHEVTDDTNEAQILIATHSPILMAYPGAQVLAIGAGKVREVDYRDTVHFELMRRFLENPEKFLAYLAPSVGERFGATSE